MPVLLAPMLRPGSRRAAFARGEEVDALLRDDPEYDFQFCLLVRELEAERVVRTVLVAHPGIVVEMPGHDRVLVDRVPPGPVDRQRQADSAANSADTNALLPPLAPLRHVRHIGRASCRARVVQYV